jgi:ATP-dependent helicase YprA (DUF1998 family)
MSDSTRPSRSPTVRSQVNDVGDDAPNNWVDVWQHDLWDQAQLEDLASPSEEISCTPNQAQANCLAGTVVDGGRFKHLDVSESASAPDVQNMRLRVGEAFQHRNRTLQLGFEKKDWQIAAASELLLGRDVTVVTGTGSGKSMCYLLTVIANLNGIIMVLSPLLSLMEDQV